MRTLLDPATRARQGPNARRAVLPLSPSATTLQLVLLYRDLLAATVQAKAAGRAYRKAAAEAPSTTPPSSGATPSPSMPRVATPAAGAAAESSPPPEPPPSATPSDAAPPDGPPR
jgi:hypothetical protein